MARAGLYKSDVRKARDAVLAEGRHPSVDTVRVALGNTGSKTTIHKYLKELEEEEGVQPRKASISDALQDLVERLAGRLHEEAEVRVQVAQDLNAAQEARHAAAQQELQQRLSAVESERDRLQAAMEAEKASHEATKSALQEVSIARHTAEQQVHDLRERLAENETHRQSLEEKHTHARQALEHYRDAAKEQREQEQRRHEQQVQQLQAELRQLQQTIVVRQGEVTRLNQQGAQLTAEVAQARRALFDEQARTRELQAQVKDAQELRLLTTDLRRQLAERLVEVSASREDVATARETLEEQSGRIRKLELLLVQAEAKAQTIDQISTGLRAFMEQSGRETQEMQRNNSDPSMPGTSKSKRPRQYP